MLARGGGACRSPYEEERRPEERISAPSFRRSFRAAARAVARRAQGSLRSRLKANSILNRCIPGSPEFLADCSGLIPLLRKKIEFRRSGDGFFPAPPEINSHPFQVGQN